MHGFTNFKPYCTIGSDVEVSVSSPNQNGQVLVHVEQPDEELIFKTLDILATEFDIVENEGFNELDVKRYLKFVKNNLQLIMELSEYKEMGSM